MRTIPWNAPAGTEAKGGEKQVLPFWQFCVNILADFPVIMLHDIRMQLVLLDGSDDGSSMLLQICKSVKVLNTMT